MEHQHKSVGEYLNLSGCSKLAPKSIKVLQDLPNLTALSLSDTILQPSVLSKPLLRHFYCPLTILHTIAEEVATLTGLKRLWLDNLLWVRHHTLAPHSVPSS
jgi:hypothetical protein